MAYVDQERKAQLAPGIKAVLKKYGVKGSISVSNHMTLVVTIKSGSIDFMSNFNELGIQRHRAEHFEFQPATDYIDVNTYWYHEHFSGVAKDFLAELIAAMNVGNWDKSDIQTDYFNVGWFLDVNIGKWNKPYVLTQ